MMQFLGIKEDIFAKIKTILPDIKICYATKGKTSHFQPLPGEKDMEVVKNLNETTQKVSILQK